MRLSTVVLLVVLIVFVSLNVSDAGRGRSSSQGSSSQGSSSRSSSKRSKPTSSNNRGSSSKPKITKYTPIKATTVSSPVIVKQTKLGSRSNTFTKEFVGYLATRYVLSQAPVYRSWYPMYGGYLTIPKKRAVRISYEEKKLLDAEGRLCLGKSSASQPLRKGIEKNLVELSTTVEYRGNKQTFQGSKISLGHIKENEQFEVTCRARYNTPIVEGTTCTQVEKKL